MQSGARHRTNQSPDSNFPGHRPDRPAFARPQPFASYAEHQTNSEMTDSFPVHDFSPDPNAEYFTAYGPSQQSTHPAEPMQAAGLPREDGPISVLHVALIAMILLIGFAIGVGRAWWIDEKLEAAALKTSVLAAAAAPSPVEEQTSSLQSSMDRAYIPPMLDSDRDAKELDNVATFADAPAPVSEPKTPTPAEMNSDSSAKSAGESSPPQEPLKASADTGKAPAASSPPEKSSAVEDKKRKSGRAGSSKKLASATKKERIKEIDRVRTQAFSETSKDRVGERKSSARDPAIGPQSKSRSSLRTSKVAQSGVTRSQYARCERIDHIIRREKCKWSLCNNKWGKGACPSFKHERPFLF